MNAPQYERLAAEIGKSVEGGVFAPGERLPSIRSMAGAKRLSLTTVKRAYLLLEGTGVIEARPQSGHFVRDSSKGVEQVMPPRITTPELTPVEPDIAQNVLRTLKAIQLQDAIPLGSPYPDPRMFPYSRISQHATTVAKRFTARSPVDDIPPGSAELIRQIARRHLQTGLEVSTEEIVVTIGATEAINLSLQCMAKPGDTIAVESPCCFVMLQAIERNGMRAVELPTHSTEGIDLEALRAAIRLQRIDGLLITPNFQSPLGFEMATEKKKALLELTAAHGIPIAENGSHNELHFGDTPPTTLKQFDTTGRVIFCGSFSKSFIAGIRIGWALPGKYRDCFERLKFLNTASTPVLPQLAIAEYLVRESWDHQLRATRQMLAQQCEIMRATVRRFFPQGTRVSHPRGGFLLWVELPSSVDARRFHHEAMANGITLAPGNNFSNSDQYRNCVRLNFSFAWSNRLEAAVRTLGAIACSMAKVQ